MSVYRTYTPLSHYYRNVLRCPVSYPASLKSKRGICQIVKKFFILKNAAALRTLFFETCNCAQFRAISYVIK